jgi:hypothetical protein
MGSGRGALRRPMTVPTTIEEDRTEFEWTTAN